MSVMYHKVEDFDKWKKAFDDFYEFRKANGELSYSVGHMADDRNTAVVINGWESVGIMDAFVSSDELKNAMKSAGVLEPPTAIVIEEVDKS